MTVEVVIAAKERTLRWLSKAIPAGSVTNASLTFEVNDQVPTGKAWLRAVMAAPGTIDLSAITTNTTSSKTHKSRTATEVSADTAAHIAEASAHLAQGAEE